MMIGGIVSLGLGGLGLGFGSIGLVTLSGSEQKVGLVLVALGFVGVAAGIPLTVIGAKKVPVKKNALLSRDYVLIEPTGNGLRMRF